MYDVMFQLQIYSKTISIANISKEKKINTNWRKLMVLIKVNVLIFWKN